jgi:large-conductance mechanosensitive channel
MDTTKIITLTVIGIIAMAISLTVTQLFLRKAKTKSENEGKINLAYGILFLGWVISFLLLNVKSISIMSEYIDTIFKTNSANHLADITKTSVLFVGLTNVWLILWYFITQAFSLLIGGKRTDINEVENNHYTYFLMKGIVFIGFIYCLMPVFEILLRTFLPNIEIPYYR